MENRGWLKSALGERLLYLVNVVQYPEYCPPVRLTGTELPGDTLSGKASLPAENKRLNYSFFKVCQTNECRHLCSFTNLLKMSNQQLVNWIIFSAIVVCLPNYNAVIMATGINRESKHEQW